HSSAICWRGSIGGHRKRRIGHRSPVECRADRHRRGSRLLDQLEMQLGELVATVSEGKAAAAIERPVLGIEEAPQKPARRSIDDKLPRERLVHSAPCECRHCGSAKIRKLDEKITETLELVPERWKVIQHVREVFTCRE